MAAAVVPFQFQGGQTRPQTFVQDALQILFDVGLLGLGLGPVEEVRGRELLGIAHYDRLLTAGDSPDGVPDGDLGGFVENHQVPGRLVGANGVLNGHVRRHRAAPGWASRPSIS